MSTERSGEIPEAIADGDILASREAGGRFLRGSGIRVIAYGSGLLVGLAATPLVTRHLGPVERVQADLVEVLEGRRLVQPVEDLHVVVLRRRRLALERVEVDAQGPQPQLLRLLGGILLFQRMDGVLGAGLPGARGVAGWSGLPSILVGRPSWLSTIKPSASHPNGMAGAKYSARPGNISSGGRT